MRIKEVILETKNTKKWWLASPQIKQEVNRIINKISTLQPWDVVDVDDDELSDAVREGYTSTWVSVLEEIIDESLVDDYLNMPIDQVKVELSKQMYSKHTDCYTAFMEKLEGTRGYEKTLDDFYRDAASLIQSAQEGSEEFIEDGGLDSEFFSNNFNKIKAKMLNTSSKKSIINKPLDEETLSAIIKIMIDGDLSEKSLNDAESVFEKNTGDIIDLTEPDNKLVKHLGNADSVFLKFYLELVKKALSQGKFNLFSQLDDYYRLYTKSNNYLDVYGDLLWSSLDKCPNILEFVENHSSEMVYHYELTGDKLDNAVKLLLKGLQQNPDELSTLVSLYDTVGKEIPTSKLRIIQNFIKNTVPENVIKQAQSIRKGRLLFKNFNTNTKSGQTKLPIKKDSLDDINDPKDNSSDVERERIKNLAGIKKKNSND